MDQKYYNLLCSIKSNKYVVLYECCNPQCNNVEIQAYCDSNCYYQKDNPLKFEWFECGWCDKFEYCNECKDQFLELINDEDCCSGCFVSNSNF